MKKFLSFLWKLLLILGGIIILALGGIEMLKQKIGEGDEAVDSIAEMHKNDWVDLGLPSGLLWANENVGGTTTEDSVYLFAWGDISCRAGAFRWTTYRFTEGDHERYMPNNLTFQYASEPWDYGVLTKYCTKPECGKNGLADNLTTLQPEDDAATVGWGKGARIPTVAEWQELKDHTTAKWTTRDGVAGMLFTGFNGNSIFLPASGWSNDGWYDGFGEEGRYWASQLGNAPIYNSELEVIMDTTYSAMFFTFVPDHFSAISNLPRYYGLAVRAVRSPEK